MDPPPPVHPSDRVLLRPATALGKPTRTTTSGASGVSFLRRTEYISNEASRSTFKSTTSASLITNAPSAKKVRSLALKAEEESDPVRILAAVMRGFDIANPETVGAGYVAKAGEDKSIKLAEENWRNLKHPTRRGVKPVATFPVLPDPDALGELNGYLVYKFSSDPLGGHAHAAVGRGVRDERVDVGMMRIRYLTEEVKAANTASQAAAAAAAGQSQTQPQTQTQKTSEREGEMTLDFYIPSDPSIPAVRAIKRKFSDIEADDAAEPTEESDRHPDGSPPEGFKYQFVRAYDQQPVAMAPQADNPSTSTNPTPTEVALVLHDPSDFSAPSPTDAAAAMCGRQLQRGAYWYPVVFRSLLRPKRNEKVAEGFFRPVTGKVKRDERDVEEEGRVDLLSVRVRELVEEERGRVEEGRRRFLGAGAVV